MRVRVGSSRDLVIRNNQLIFYKSITLCKDVLNRRCNMVHIMSENWVRVNPKKQTNNEHLYIDF